MVEYFEVVKVEEIPETLEECDKGVDGNAEGRFRPNGFYGLSGSWPQDDVPCEALGYSG